MATGHPQGKDSEPGKKSLHRESATRQRGGRWIPGLAAGWGPRAVGLAVTAALAASPAVRAGPQGGQVVAGSAVITQSAPGRVDVVQSSGKAIVDWRSFSIGAGEHTHFQQPSSASATLNRVKGGDPSRILGRLTANGQVMLVNPNGVFFGPGSRVDVGALMASTADVANDDFLAGRYRFTTPSADPDAGIVNQGEIRAADGGFVVLAAPYVRNEGSIQARLGQVVLAGAPTFTVDFDGDGLLQFDIGGPVQAAPRGDDGQAVDALVANPGTVQADGGRVTLTARAADQVIDRVIHMGGVVQAQTVESRGGEIILGGGDVGTVAVSGTLDASGPAAAQRGGTVKVLGERVGVFDGARVDASGGAGGGKVLIGGNFRGQGPEPNARRTYVSRQASLKADALVYGGGGTLIVWSDEATAYHGRASARGGPDGGPGGLVEVSGKQSLVFAGEVDLSAPRGALGTLLLDPATLTIVDFISDLDGVPDGSQDANLLQGVPIGEILAGDPDIPPNTVSWNAIRSLVAGNVILEAAGDVTVGDISGVTFDLGDIALLNVASLTIRSLSGSIAFADLADSIHTTGGDLVLSAGGNITAGTLVTVGPAVTGSDSGSISLTAGGGISAVYLNTSSSWGNAGNVTLTATTGNIAIDGAIDASSSPGNGGSIVLNAGGNVTGASYFSSYSNAGDGGAITINAGGAVSLYGLRSYASDNGGAISITAAGNVVTGELTATGGPLGGDITVRSTGGNVDTSSIFLDDGVFFGGSVSATASDGTGGAVTFRAVGTITPADNVLTTSNRVTFDGPVALTANNPYAGATVSVVIDGDGGDIAFTSTVNQARDLLLSAGAGSIRVAGPAGASQPLTSLTANSAAELSGAVTTGAQSYNAGLTASGDYRTGGGPFTVTGPLTVAGASAVTTGGGAFSVSGATTLGADLAVTTAGGALGFGGPVTGPHALSLSTSGLLTVEVPVNVGPITLTAGDLDLVGSGTVLTGAGELRLQPLDPAASIGLGSGLGDFRLTQSEIDRVAPTFASLTIGRDDGRHAISIVDATFGLPVTIQTPAGGQTVVDATEGATGLFGYGSVTVVGSGATTFLNADIRTAGQPIVIRDSVVLGGATTLDTSGGAISLLGALDGAYPLALQAGAGDVTFGGPVGGSAAPTAVDLASARNVRIGARFSVGDLSLNHTGDASSTGGALDVGTLFINPDAASANLFGRVRGRSGWGAAQSTDGPRGDPDFRVNGFVVGLPPPELSIVVPSVFPFGNALLAEPQAAGGQQLRLPTPQLWVVAQPQFLAGDPTQAQFSNFGNPELWGEGPGPEAGAR
ncbi:MAG: filamentous hemagglutinin N-terminal domain-containing protein [Gammaproteobacteria bacterium]|jgi:filamentous hemagglutinin family protein|nr:filamentous hemagglutinin N-terminal domain-containing protein [Gammaproteobacteria bacterium]